MKLWDGTGQLPQFRETISAAGRTPNAIYFVSGAAKVARLQHVRCSKFADRLAAPS
ncbi:hypothetical protein [Aporhodopirellula aestuarii]|uniref:Uncharacterized protein n=1 Tax=Aporhodopirellula aestuarii TaxID=2950107 RepID=A0ABT0U9W2_9BACT|nr:hypothetical protein [Aporhodopirellula aestuarii]MCM2373683.1 hypothetical protein [Aporhodopirellula aestuarii]